MHSACNPTLLGGSTRTQHALSMHSACTQHALSMHSACNPTLLGGSTRTQHAISMHSACTQHAITLPLASTLLGGSTGLPVSTPATASVVSSEAGAEQAGTVEPRP